MRLWRPKRNYSCLHHSLALGSREFTLDFQGISDFFQTLRVSEVALDKAVEENSFDFIPALASTDPGPLKCGHPCKLCTGLLHTNRQSSGKHKTNQCHCAPHGTGDWVLAMCYILPPRQHAFLQSFFLPETTEGVIIHFLNEEETKGNENRPLKPFLQEWGGGMAPKRFKWLLWNHTSDSDSKLH